MKHLVSAVLTGNVRVNRVVGEDASRAINTGSIDSVDSNLILSRQQHRQT